ncbi:MAG TPA: hypothetical protein VGC08_14555, partial [Pedobacter sp.]
IVYLSGARNMDAHGQFMDYNLEPIVDFPLFYPFFLSIIGFISRLDQLVTAPYINGALLAVIIIICGHLIDSFEGVNKWYKRVILIFIAISPSMLDIYGMLWSETLFILLTIVFIAAFSRYLRTRSVRGLLVCAFIAAIACVTRYAGVTIIGTGLMLIVFDLSVEWRKKIIHGLLFGAVSVSLLIANLVRNTLITGSLTGPREKGILLLSDNIVFYGRVICWWLPVPGDQARLVSAIAIIIFIIISAMFLLRSWFRQNYASAENCFAAFFIVYTVFIIAISTLSHFEQINNRFVSPVFIPMLIALTSWIPRTVRKWKPLEFRLALAVIALIAIVFEYHQYKNAAEMYEDAKNNGIAGYTEDYWKNNETAKFLREHPAYFNPQYTVYSNAHEAAYFNGGLQTVSLPHRNDKRDMADFFTEDEIYLIWFDNFSDNELIKFKTIWDNAKVVKKYDFRDGDIFFIKLRHAPQRRQ